MHHHQNAVRAAAGITNRATVPITLILKTGINRIMAGYAVRH